MPGAQTEARIAKTSSILLALSPLDKENPLRDFCGRLLASTEEIERERFEGKSVYLCGDIAKAAPLEPVLRGANRVVVVREHSQFDASPPWPLIGEGQVPLLVHDAGVLYRRFFDFDQDYFGQVRDQHEFQALTESNKPGKAHRTGIYLTPVEQRGDERHFRLLRCSSNLAGPAENFGPVDHRIVDALNRAAAEVFADHAALNHVLAQIYWNTPATATQKQTKAKIKGHSDKTKDMPANGVMAFCTFYDQLSKVAPLAGDSFDHGYKKASGLTRLHFRLKAAVAERPGCELAPQFGVTLYPNSVFFMPLSTNRLYTHEVRPAGLDASMLPTRMGYVVRCSDCEAVHKDGHTFLKKPGGLVALEPPSPEGVDQLRGLYADENRTDGPIEYGDRFLFSMNEGDYLKPKCP